MRVKKKQKKKTDFKNLFFIKLHLKQPVNKDHVSQWRKQSSSYHIFYRLSEFDIPYCFAKFCHSEAVLYSKRTIREDPLFAAI